MKFGAAIRLLAVCASIILFAGLLTTWVSFYITWNQMGHWKNPGIRGDFWSGHLGSLATTLSVVLALIAVMTQSKELSDSRRTSELRDAVSNFYSALRLEAPGVAGFACYEALLIDAPRGMHLFALGLECGFGVGSSGVPYADDPIRQRTRRFVEEVTLYVAEDTAVNGNKLITDRLEYQLFIYGALEEGESVKTFLERWKAREQIRRRMQ